MRLACVNLRYYVLAPWSSQTGPDLRPTSAPTTAPYSTRWENDICVIGDNSLSRFAMRIVRRTADGSLFVKAA